MTRARRKNRRRRWPDADKAALRRRYPYEKTATIARDLDRTLRQVYAMASRLGLRKSAAFMASDRSGRIQRGRTDPRMVRTQFRKGHATWNKGTHYCAGGRSAETRFKKGEMHGAAQHKYKPIGTERVSKEGNLERKVTDAGDTNRARMRRWVPVARLVWEAAHGPIPKHHVVRFKAGMHTTEASEITLDKIECISKAENMRRNSFHRYPQPIPQLIQLRGALNRKINRKGKAHEKQD